MRLIEGGKLFNLLENVEFTAKSAMNPEFIDNYEKASVTDFFIPDAKSAKVSCMKGKKLFSGD